MPYVTGIATITIHSDGRRDVVTRDLRVVDGAKPRRIEDSGTDKAVWERILLGEPGIYDDVVVHVGGATALLVPRRAITLSDPSLMDQLQASLGQLGEEALLCAVRTGVAAATRDCCDTTGAMATTLDLEGNTLAAIPKILVSRLGGWVRLILPPEMTNRQATFDAAQRERWSVARPGFAQAHDVRISFPSVGQDTWNGRSTLVVFGPLGDCQYINVARLERNGDDYRFCDGESKPGQRAINQRRPDMWQFHDETVPTLVPLHRKLVAITTVANHPYVPLVLELGADGSVRDGGLHFLLEGEFNRRRLLSHNPRRVLGSHGLGWLIT